MDLLEREQSLQRLARLTEMADHGEGRVALIRGEAGIGKTSVVKEFVAGLDDAHVMWGGCDDLMAARPLGPLWDMAIDEPALEGALTSTDRLGAFQAVLELLSRALRSTVMIIEDVHWADDATLDLIKFVGRRIERTHGLLVLTYRDGEIQGDHPLRVALGDLPHGLVERIPLEPLSEEAVRALAGDDVDVHSLWEITRGNPFFVSEALSAGGEAVPSSVRDLVHARVQRLTPSARELVELASVVPSKIELDIVEDVLGESSEAIAECEEAGILQLSGDSLRFRHELARRAVEEDLPSIRRRKLNLASLRACEQRGSDMSRCAHHARQAEDPESILRILPASARRASELESHAEALTTLRALEPYLDSMSPEEQADHYDLWAYEEYLARDIGSELVERAIALRRALGDPARLGDTLLLASRISWVRSRRAEAISHAEEAVDILEAVGGEKLALAYSTLSQLAMLGNQEEPTIEYARRALDIVGDDRSQARVHALNNIGAVIMHNHYPEGIPELEDSHRLATELGLSHDAARAAVNLSWGYIHVKDLDPAQAWIEKAIEITSAAEMPSFESYARTELAMWHELRGEWDVAETICRDVLDGSALLAGSRATTLMVLAKIQARRGRVEAGSLVAEAMSVAEEAEEIQRLGPAAAVVAEYHWLGGDVPDRLLERAVEIRDLCLRLGDRWLAGELSQWLHLGRVTSDDPEELPDPYRYLIAGDWRGAARWWGSKGVVYERAVALSLGDVESKLDALRDLDDLGAVPFAARLRAGMQAEGVRRVPRGPQRETRDHPLGLTARQTDVLDLMAEGLTNAQIADRLFISTRTVDHHVSAILAKLGAGNRSEAVEKAKEMLTLT